MVKNSNLQASGGRRRLVKLLQDLSSENCHYLNCVAFPGNYSTCKVIFIRYEFEFTCPNSLFPRYIYSKQSEAIEHCHCVKQKITVEANKILTKGSIRKAEVWNVHTELRNAAKYSLESRRAHALAGLHAWTGCMCAQRRPEKLLSSHFGLPLRFCTNKKWKPR